MDMAGSAQATPQTRQELQAQVDSYAEAACSVAVLLRSTCSIINIEDVLPALHLAAAYANAASSLIKGTSKELNLHPRKRDAMVAAIKAASSSAAVAAASAGPAVLLGLEQPDEILGGASQALRLLVLCFRHNGIASGYTLEAVLRLLGEQQVGRSSQAALLRLLGTRSAQHRAPSCHRGSLIAGR